MARMATTITRALCVAVVTAGVATSGMETQQGSLSPALDRYLRQVVKPTTAERRNLIAGAPIVKLLPADETKEVAVFGAIWIDAPASFITGGYYLVDGGYTAI